MSAGSRWSRWITIPLALWLVTGSFLFVDETEFVLVERFGQLVAVYDRAEDRGLHFKLPWPMETVRRFDSRVQLLAPTGRETFTRDRKNVVVEAYCCWRIAESPSEKPRGPLEDRPVARFFRSMGQTPSAQTWLQSRLQSIVTTELARWELGQLLHVPESSTAETVDEKAASPENHDASPLEQLSQKLLSGCRKQPDEAESLTGKLGIEILDVRIRRLNLPAGNQAAVFERMKSERRQIAERYRNAGQAESRRIRSQAERQAGEILAKAQAEADRIRGEGEAAAAKILNEAYSADPEFARFWQTLETYKQIFHKRVTLVLSTGHPLFRLLASPKEESAKPPAE